MSGRSIDLGSYVFDLIYLPHKFTTEGNLSWTIQYGLAEVIISLEETFQGAYYLTLSFAGNNTRNIFRYGYRTANMDASQSNKMLFSATKVDEISVKFSFDQPKELTVLGVSEFSWSITSTWQPLDKVEVAVAVEPVVTVTTFSV